MIKPFSPMSMKAVEFKYIGKKKLSSFTVDNDEVFFTANDGEFLRTFKVDSSNTVKSVGTLNLESLNDSRGVQFDEIGSSFEHKGRFFQLAAIGGVNNSPNARIIVSAS